MNRLTIQNNPQTLSVEALRSRRVTRKNPAARASTAQLSCLIYRLIYPDTDRAPSHTVTIYIPPDCHLSTEPNPLSRLCVSLSQPTSVTHSRYAARKTARNVLLELHEKPPHTDADAL